METGESEWLSNAFSPNQPLELEVKGLLSICGVSEEITKILAYNMCV